MAIVPVDGWSMPEGVIPDAITPRVGWRSWVWTGRDLVSPLYRRIIWHPGEALVATCLDAPPLLVKYGIASLRSAPPAHRAPHRRCMCGIYAVTGPSLQRAHDVMTRNQGKEFPVIGRVALWGVVEEHEQGYRAQFAYPQAFYVPRRDLKKARRKLAAYGVPVMEMEAAGLEVPMIYALRALHSFTLLDVLLGVGLGLLIIQIVVFGIRLYLQGAMK